MTFSHSLSQIPTENQILKNLKRIIFGKRLKCPDCGRQMYVVEIVKNKTFRCKKCRNKFSLTSINWLRGMKITYQHLWLLIYCWQKKLNVGQTVEISKLSLITVRRYYELFRDNLNLDTEVILEGKVQIDEMFVKGAFVIGGKDINRKKIKLKVFCKKSPDKSDSMNFIFNHVKPGSTVCTDGSSIYKACENFWPVKHERDIHKKFEFKETSEIEGLWANFRTFVRRMYHHVTLKKLIKIVAEFEARFSQKEIFNSVLTFLENTLSTVKLAL